MIGERMGEMIGKAIRARLRGIVADYWLIGLALVLFAAGLWIGGSQ